MVGTALTGVSVAGKVAKFATGKAMEANSRDKALREVIYSDEIQSIEDQVTAAGLLTREERETQLANGQRHDGPRGPAQQDDRAAGHPPARADPGGRKRGQHARAGRLRADDARGDGLYRPREIRQDHRATAGGKAGFTGANWREAMQDPKEEKRQKKQAEKQARNDEVRKMMRKAAAQKEKKEAKRRGKTLEKLKKQQTVSPPSEAGWTRNRSRKRRARSSSAAGRRPAADAPPQAEHNAQRGRRPWCREQHDPYIAGGVFARVRHPHKNGQRERPDRAQGAPERSGPGRGRGSDGDLPAAA